MRRKFVIIALMSFGLVLNGYGRVRAEPATDGRDVSAARSLSDQALALLRQGEDGTAKDTKLRCYQECLDHARRAVALDEANADAHYAIFACDGRIEMVEGIAPNPLNLMRVSRELDRCLELDPNHSDALAARGGLYRQLPWLLGGNLDKAEEYLNRSLAIDPASPTVLMELAETYRAKGQPARAVPLLRQAVKVAEDQKKARQLNEARELLQEATQSN